MLYRSLSATLSVCLGLAAFAQNAVLLDEDFSSYSKGAFSSEVGAHTEYHYLPEAAPIGPWGVTSFRSEVASQLAWRVIEHDGHAAMAQFYKNKWKHTHPMLVAGDAAWSNYTLEVSYAPSADTDQSGVVVRYHNDRCYYFFGVEGQMVVLKEVTHETAFRVPGETVLAEAPFTWSPGATMKAVVAVAGTSITASVEGGPTLTASDDTYPLGKIAITSDVPTVFSSVRVTTTTDTKAAIDNAIKARSDEESALQTANPSMVLWKKFSTADFGVGRNVRFGDLDGDGVIDMLIGQMEHHGPKDRNSEVSCLTAVNMDGKRLWQIGKPDAWRSTLSNDVAFQIHDIDGDGKQDVIYAKNMELIIADGATGETKHKIETPASPPNSKPDFNAGPKIYGDSILFCDVRGVGRKSDILLKDRYQSVWVYNDKLELLWHKQCNTGHYPFAYDVDGDGKDEVIVGYTLFDDNGERLWTLENEIEDHADGVAIVKFTEDAEPRLLCAASDEGLFFANMKGEIIKHHRVGHVQNPAIADFRPDMPGLEAVSIDFWGNQGIIHQFNADGEIYNDFEPSQHGSMMLPINWTGKPGEFFVLSANVDEGGLFDGWGRRVLKFPADGHPDMCNAVLDITGDCRDEIVVWDPNEVWIYTQSDSPISGKLYKPTRNPLFNYSNYQATVSLPGWSE